MTDPQKIAGRRPRRSEMMPETIGPRAPPMKTDAVLRPVVAAFRLK